MNPINVTLSRCRHRQPLIELHSQPFNDLEITPKDLRHMAQQLLALADLAQQLPTGGQRFVPTRLVLGDAPLVCPAPQAKAPVAKASAA